MDPNVAVEYEDGDQKSVELCVTAKKLMIQSNDADCAAIAAVGGLVEVEVSDDADGKLVVDGDGDGAKG